MWYLGVLGGGEKTRMSVVMAELLISHQSVSYLHGRPKEMDEKVTDGGEFINLPCSFLSNCSFIISFK